MTIYITVRLQVDIYHIMNQMVTIMYEVVRIVGKKN